ncbi:sigma-70 family RNA polymerase sigma factor [Microbispora sp. NPDC046933]|uniref:RNA polymerase sigma factor n=1 Tax=Microbispora sp. NPDC046933 TaxID=3155618 RepID=UPI003407C34F
MRPFPLRLPRGRPHPPPVSPSSDDHDLMAAVAAERVEALRLLHDRHAPWLRARLLRRCADPDLVDDAIQDTFVAVWRGARRYTPQGEDAAAWIWTIAARRLASGLRRPGGRWIAAATLTEADARLASAEDNVLLGVEHGDLGGALARLSPELRAVIQATVLDGLTVREASRLLGIPEGTVKTRLMRAKARLREELA